MSESDFPKTVEVEASASCHCYTDDEIFEMADRIAVALLKVGDDGEMKAYRVQFKLGKYGQEMSGGGLNRIGLKLELARQLKAELGSV
jgi:hypothetical protein